MKKNDIKYYSFDMFDTLVVRNVLYPSDIFELVEREYNKNNIKKINNFKQNRIIAESNIRLKSKKEITIDDIYNEIGKLYSDYDIDFLKSLEKKIEIEYCQLTPNTSVINLFKSIPIQNRIIISDMYLDRKTITKILNKNGIKYYKLYLSSEISLKKSTGELFDYVINDLNITNKEIMHIGDNKKSDYIIPKNKGIICKLVRNNCNKDYHNLDINTLNKFINNNISDEFSYYQELGYKNLGPILLSFSKNLKEELEKNNINKVYFFSRDGYIMKEVFDLINDNDCIKTYYMYASRRSLIVPSLWKCTSAKDIIASMQMPKTIKIIDLLKKLGLDDKSINCENICLENEYDVNSVDVLNIITKNMDTIMNNSKFEYNNLCKYLNSINFNGKVAIVDIGWFGNMQKALEKLFPNISISGYYIGIKENKYNTNISNVHGFLFDRKKNIDSQIIINQFNALFEFLFLTQHGSVKRFNGKKEIVELYRYEYENQEEKIISKEIHDGSLMFIKDILKQQIKYEYFDNYICSYNLFEIATHPSMKDVNKLGSIMFKDNKISRIIDFKYCYLFNYKKLISSLNNCYWRIGFMKKVFRLPINYYSVYLKIYKLKKRG